MIKTNKEQAKTAVPALDRAVAVLDLLCYSTAPLTAAEIARQLGIPRSSMHGLLMAMVTHGLITKTALQQYSVGSRVLPWSGRFIERQDIVMAFQQQFAESSEFSPYSLTLTYFDHKDVVCLAFRNGDGRLGFTFSIGLRLPAGFAATGRAVLSTYSDAQVQTIFNDDWHPLLTPYSIGSCEELLEELAVTRQRGYSIDDRQIRDGMFCIGVPVFDHTNQATNGIALSLQKSEATDELVVDLGNKLRHMADGLSRHLGARL